MAPLLDQLAGLMPSGGPGTQTTLRTIFAVHAPLIAIVLMGGWVPLSCAFYNGLFLFGLLWTMHQHMNDLTPASIELPITMSVFMNLIGFVLDLIMIIFRYRYAVDASIIALLACLANMLLRAVSTLMLVKTRNGLDPAGRTGTSPWNRPAATNEFDRDAI